VCLDSEILIPDPLLPEHGSISGDNRMTRSPHKNESFSIMKYLIPLGSDFKLMLKVNLFCIVSILGYLFIILCIH